MEIGEAKTVSVMKYQRSLNFTFTRESLVPFSQRLTRHLQARSYPELRDLRRTAQLDWERQRERETTIFKLRP